MSHTRCDACPVAAGARCPGEARTRLCHHAAAELLEADPRQHHWRGSIRAQAAALAGLPAPPDPAPFRPVRPAGGRVRAGLLCPVLVQGGAEAHQLTLARAVDPARVAWAGCVSTSSQVDPDMAAAMAALMPVGEGRADARALAADCDVLITWAIPDLPRILEGLPRPPKVVGVVHAPADSPWGQSAYAEAGGIDRWVAVSELAMEAIPASSLAAAPAATIWNAVDAARMEVARPREEMRRAWGVPEGARVAGYLGRLSSEKRPEVMADLARLLPWHVVVVGAGFEWAAMEARSAGLARFHMPGPDGHAGDVLNAFDTLVVPSEYESFGLTMAEGFWAGVPVISTPVGLAKLAPGLAREVPAMATGADIAAAILADEADLAGTAARVLSARAFARDRLDPVRFGREWTDFLAEVACPGHHIADAGKMIADHVADPDKMVANPHMARLALVRACPERGEAVGCSCQGLHACRAGKGATPGTTTIAECLDCVAGTPDG